MSFKQLSKIDSRTKDAVNGWIRNTEKALKTNNVPAMINTICILYFREYETFDKDLISQLLTVDSEYKYISSDNDTNGPIFSASAFGSNICVKGRKYYWMIKIEEGTELISKSINIGIIENDAAKKNEIGWYFESYGYSYHNNGSTWNKGCSGGITKMYGDFMNVGDIIHVWLDLKDSNTLSYGKNDKHYGVAFDIDNDKEYRLAVQLQNAKISIQNFDVIYA